MIGKAINATLGKHFATSLASVLVSVARVFQLRTPVEELEDELVGFATHCDDGLERVFGGLHVSIGYLGRGKQFKRIIEVFTRVYGLIPPKFETVVWTLGGMEGVDVDVTEKSRRQSPGT
jgi:hypothetical protein